MVTDLVQDNILLQFSCFYPLFTILVGIYGIIYNKIQNNKKLFKLFIFYLFGIFLCEYGNIILKNKIFIPLGEAYGTKIGNNRYLGFLGRVERPDGACNCGIIRNGKKNLALSSGMPSGHSQLAWFVFSFFASYLYDIKYKHKNILIIFGGFLSTFLSYSRVLVNCHTIEQIVVGSGIGFVFGLSWYKIYKFFS